MRLEDIWQLIYDKEDIVLTIYGITVVILLFVFLQSWRRGRYTERENYYLDIQRVLMQQHYELVKEQIENTRKLRHDIANHIYTLEALEAEGHKEEVSKYREYLKEQYEKLKQTGYTSDVVIDAVVCQKMKTCKEKGIHLDVELLTLSLEQMQEFERMQFFFELIEHAIQKICASRTEDVGGTIHLASEVKAGYVMIECELSPVKGKNMEERTTLRELKCLAEKYGGFLRVENAGKTQKIQAAIKGKY